MNFLAELETGTVLKSRYRVLGELGHGATGRVLRVHDLRKRRDCALKLFDPQGPADPLRAGLFEEEFRVLRSLSHPAVVEAYEFGRLEDLPFFTLEHASGVDLKSSIQAILASGGKRRLGPRAGASLLRILGQILQGLEHIHRRGFRHCDIKPKNIRVAEETVKLLDLGLARPLSRSDAASAGTLNYLAPEVLRGQPADRRADLYALGVTLYEALTGSIPWANGEGVQVEGGVVRGALTCRLNSDLVPSIREQEPRVPVWVDQVVLRLLAPRPEERFPTANRVIDELNSLAKAEISREIGGDATPTLLEPRFVGREREREQVLAALNDPVPTLVVVSGPSGCGKSRLLRELKASCQLAGLSTLDGGGITRHGPLRPYRELLDSQRQDPPSRVATDPADSPQISREHQARYVREVARALAEPSDSEQRVLFLEDVHAFDPDAAAPLEVLLGRLRRGDLPATAPRLVLSFRPGEFVHRELEERLGQTVAAHGHELRLDPLPTEAVEELVESTLSACEDLDASDQRHVAGWVATRSQGHPYLAVELTRSLVNTGALRGPARGLLARLGRLGLSSDLKALEQSRIKQLARGPRKLLSLLAVFARPVSLGLLRRAADTAVKDVLADLRTLERAGLTGSDPDGAWRVTHDVLREAIYSGLRSRRRKPLHDLVAAALSAGSEAEDPAEVARHRLRGESAAQAADDALTAAHDCEARGELSRARGLFEGVTLAIPPADPRRGEALCRLASLEELAGEHARAQAHLEEALPRAQPGPPKAEILRRLSRLAGYTQASRELDLLEQAQRELGSAEAPRLRADIARTLVWAHKDEGDLEAAKRSCDEGLAAEKVEQTGLGFLGLLHARGTLCAVDGDFAEAERDFHRCMELLEAEDNSTWPTLILSDLARVQGLLGRYEEAERHLQQALASARRLGFSRQIAMILNKLAVQVVRRGRLHDAEAYYRSGLRELEPGSDLLVVWRLQANLAYLLLDRGALGEAARLFAQAHELARGTSREADAIQGLAALAFCLGDEGSAEERLQQARATRGQEPGWMVRLEEARQRSGYLWRAGEHDRARDQAQLVVRLAGEDPRRTRERLTAQLLVGWANHASGDPAAALRAAQVVLEEARGTAADGLVEGKARLLLGVARKDLGEVEAATKCLEACGCRLELLEGLRQRARLADSLGLEAQQTQALEAGVRLAHELAATLPTQLAERFLARPDVAALLTQRPRKRAVPDTSGGLLEKVLAVNAALGSPGPPGAVLAALLDAAIGLVRAERGFVLLREPGGMRVRFHRNFDREDLRRPVGKFSRSIAEAVCRDGTPLLTLDAEHDVRLRSFSSVGRLHLASVICAPLRVDGEVVGVIYLDNRLVVGAFSQSDVPALVAFADQAAIALRNASLIEDLLAARGEAERLNQELEQALGRERRQHSQTQARLKQAEEELELRYDYCEIAGRGPRMRQVLVMLDRITDADVDACVLLTGETGTGKELLARALHRNSARCDEPFLSLNCAALPDSLLESELFGHKRGAFTGAHADNPGLLVAAGSGTLFLDEVGELGQRAQAALLRAVQEREVLPVGARRPVPFKARLVAATHRDLRQRVQEGAFREDLLYRLNVLHVPLPALRERREDLAEITTHVLARISKTPPELAPQALAAIESYAWPGNVRELENELRRALIFARGSVLELEDLSEALREAPMLDPDTVGPDALKRAVSEAERKVFRAVLRRTGGNQSEAARLLGMSRFGFGKAVKRLGIHVQRG